MKVFLLLGVVIPCLYALLALTLAVLGKLLGGKVSNPKGRDLAWLYSS
jgi:hypothetical protein